MSDLFGHSAERKPFTDIRDQRDSVAHEKALLCKKLNELLRKTPSASQIASIQSVTKFKAAHASALKVLQSKRSSRSDLQSAINSLNPWHEVRAA